MKKFFIGILLMLAFATGMMGERIYAFPNFQPKPGKKDLIVKGEKKCSPRDSYTALN